MPTSVNPYAERRTREGEAPGTQLGTPIHPKYAVPDVSETTDPDYTLGYATELDPDYESGTTPDPIRTGQQKPPINDPNNRAYWRRRTAELHERQAQDQYVTGWDVEQHPVPPGQNPLWEQDRPPTRPTANNAPTGYMHTRPWHIPRFLHDVDPSQPRHISMADHRRQYEIYGMRSTDRMGVNTHRLDPVPWDQGLFPPDQHAEPERSNNAAQSGNGAYRLG